MKQMNAGAEKGAAMAKANTNFELSVDDLDTIEAALRARKQALHGETCDTSVDEKRTIHDLLGRLHNQKVFYRPSGAPYVGG
ncbi:hypothetical protein [Pseudaestuariivita sp.]|uniref:hypothetical protein n=1 Tax=Pseudaestuariivita sp. TaxID=2211669 RepID=UPI004059A2F2